MERELLFEAKKLTKHFGPTVALDNVDFKVYRGEITGLIGQYAHGNEPGHHTVYMYNRVGCFSKDSRINRQQ